MRIVQQAQGNAPVGDRAFRIGLQRLLENLFRRPVPERVLIAHPAVKAALRHLIAGGLEVNLAKLLVGSVLRACGRRGGDRAQYSEGEKRDGSQGERAHWPSVSVQKNLVGWRL